MERPVWSGRFSRGLDNVAECAEVHGSMLPAGHDIVRRGGRLPRLRAPSRRSIPRIAGGAGEVLRVAARSFVTRPQAFEQALEERLVSRQAPCPVSVSFGPEPLGVPRLLSVSRAVTKGHCLLPASGGCSLQWAEQDDPAPFACRAVVPRRAIDSCDPNCPH